MTKFHNRANILIGSITHKLTRFLLNALLLIYLLTDEVKLHIWVRVTLYTVNILLPRLIISVFLFAS